MSGKKVEGPLRGIVKRQEEVLRPYGVKVVRHLECGHTVREPHGSKAKTATHARCKTCGYRVGGYA